MEKTYLELAKNCLRDIQNYQPWYPPQTDLSRRDKWLQYKYWLKNYARMSSLLYKVGPIKLMKAMKQYPWLYDMLKINNMFQRSLYGRTDHYREAMCVIFDGIIYAAVNFLEWTINMPDRIILKENMIPPEILRAMGLVDWIPEVFGIMCTMIDNHCQDKYIDIAENAGIAPNCCTLLKITDGISLAGHCPKGAAMITSNMPCDAGSASYTMIAQKADNIPIYRLDVPHYFKEERALDYFVEDLKQMIKWLEEHTPGRMDWAKLKEICEERNHQAELEMELMEINRQKPTPMPGEALWLWHLVSYGTIPGSKMHTRVSQKLVDLAKKNLAEKKGACAKERYRALFWNPVPAMFSDIGLWCEDVWGITFFVDSMSYHPDPAIDTSTPESMLRGLGHIIMNGSMARHTRGPADNYFTDLFYLVDEYELDMVILALHVGCKNTQAMTNFVRERCREKNIPLLCIEYDLMDERVVSRKNIMENISHFMENVMRAERLSDN